MIWDLGQDYFTSAGRYDSSKSLLPAVKRGIDAWKSASASSAHAPASQQRAIPASASPFSSTAIGSGKDSIADEIFGTAAAL